jgi:uncharacterized membrane protein (DUF4010 family)
MDTTELLSRFAVALGIGLLIGLERGWKTREAKAGSRTAGIRTFTISSLLGGVIGACAQIFGGAGSVGGGLLLAIAFAAYAAVMAMFFREENRSDKVYSATSAVAAMLAFALGAYALVGDMLVAAAGAVATAGLLAAREDLHGWVEQVTWPELRSGIVLLAMTFIALPLVPDDPIGPFGGVNPRQVWLIAIVLASVSFLGYAGVKYFGAHKGLLFAAAAGALVSSTAVTVTNARHAAAGEGDPSLLAAGVMLATAISFLRVLAIVLALNPALLVLLAAPLLCATVVAGGYAAIAVHGRDRRSDNSRAAGQFRNPFNFWSVVGFALFLGVVILAGRALAQGFGAAATALGALAMGLADVDALTVSLARLAPQTLSIDGATYAILAGVTSNTLSKIAIGGAIGRGRFAVKIAAVSLACLAAGAAALWLALLFAR